MHQCISGSSHSVFHEHGNSHWTHTSRNRCYETCFLLHSWNKIPETWYGVKQWSLFSRKCKWCGGIKIFPLLRQSWQNVLLVLPSKSTSPMRRTFPVFWSRMRFMPTSITAAPFFTMSAVIRPGTPDQRGNKKAYLEEKQVHRFSTMFNREYRLIFHTFIIFKWDNNHLTCKYGFNGFYWL